MHFSFRKSFRHHDSYHHVKSNSVRTSSSNGSSRDSYILFDQERLRKIADVESQVSVIRMDSGRGIGNDNGNGGADSNDRNSAPAMKNRSENDNKDRDIKSSDNKRGSFEFRQRRDDRVINDPASKLIGQFLTKQKTHCESALDMDLDMDELRLYKQHDNKNYNHDISSRSNNTSSWPYSTDVSRERSRETRVSFEPSSEIDGVRDSMTRQYKDLPEQTQKEQNRIDEILRCTLSSLHRRTATITSSKRKSRLQDPSPEEIIELRSGRIPKSGELRSGLLGKMVGSSADDDDDETFSGEDFPEEYTKSKFSLLVLIEWVSLILIVAALVCSLSIDKIRKKCLWDLKLWKWEVMVLVLICGRLVSGWGILLLVIFIERNFILRKKLLYFVYGVKKPVQNCLWLGLVLAIWYHLFHGEVVRKTSSEILTYITKILVCLMIGTLLWLVKTLLIKVLASSFHARTYFDRIQESLFCQYVIESLSGPVILEIQMNHDDDKERAAADVKKLQNAGAVLPPDLRDASFAKSDRVIGKSWRHDKSIIDKLSRGSSQKGTTDGMITIDHLHKLNLKNVSAWNMKRLVKMVRHGSLTTLDEQVSERCHEADDSANQIRSELEAKAAARKIFLNVARAGSRFIYLEDLLRFMLEEEALKTFGLFEGSTENGRISKKALKKWVVNAYRERRALALTLNDAKTAVKRLHHVVNIVASIIILVIWLLVLKIATSKFLLYLTSQLVLAAFVFGNTCKIIFESLIFLFVIHPFDVGDRCEIDEVQMIVEEMNILTTVFLRFDNLKVIYPNSVLSTKPIFNYYRSPDMYDSIEFCVHIITPCEKIAKMKQKIVSYIENSEHWSAAPIIVVKEVEDLTSLRIVVWSCHKMNFQDMEERYKRRSILLEEMVKIFRELDIEYRLFPLDVNAGSIPSPVLSERITQPPKG